MRVIILLVAIFGFFSVDTFAQVKQAQKSYLRDKGAFINPGFDQGYKGWTITGCTKSLESDIPTYGKTLKLTCINETFSIKQETVSYAGFGLEGLSSCKVKASAIGGKVRQIIDGTPVFSYEAATVGDYKNHEEFIAFGATSNGLEIYADSNYTGDIYVEDCYISPKPDGSYKLPDQTGNFGKVLAANDAQGEYWVKPGRLNSQLKGNLLSNGSFESGSPEGVSAVGSGIDLSAATTRSSQASANNDSALKLEGSASDTLSYTYTKTADFSDQQMIGFCQIKTTRPETYFKVYSDSNLQGEHLVINDGQWRFYEVPFVGGSTDQAFVVDGTTATTEHIEVDECYFGITRPDFFKEVGQAHFVGSLTYQTSSSCTWTVSSGSWGATPVDNDCVATNITGNVLAPTTKIPAIRIPNAKTNGHYSVSWQGLLYKSVTDGVCEYTLSSIDDYDNQGVAYTEGATNRGDNNLVGNFRFTSTGDKEISVIAKIVSGTGDCGIYGRPDIPSKMIVNFYPDANSTVVTQDTELTAKTANYLNFKTNDAGAITSQDYPDSGVTYTQNALGDYTLDFTSLGLANTPKFDCLTKSSSSIYTESCNIESESNTSVSFFLKRVSHSAGANNMFNGPLQIGLAKQGSDVNKSQAIVGKFEQIENITGELTAQTANILSADISASGVVSNDTFDFINGDCTNATTSFCTFNSDIFTVPPKCWIEGVRNDISCTPSAGAITSTNVAFTCFNSDGTALTTSTVKQLFCEKQGADYNKSFVGAVVNLSKQKTLCQTKTLASSVTSTGVMTDLTFNNLDLTKRYSLAGHFYPGPNGVTGNKYVFLLIGGVEAVLEPYYVQGDYSNLNVPLSIPKKIFKPSNTTIDFEITAISGFTLYGDKQNSWVQLCELPDSYQETTKFD